MYWPLAKASGDRSLMDEVQRERLHQHDPAQRLHDPLPEGLAAQLGQQARQRGVVRRGRTPSRSRGSRARAACRRRGTRAIRRRPSAAARCSAWVLPVQPGGSSSIVSTRTRGSRAANSRGDLAGPVACSGRRRPGSRGRDRSGRRPTPGSRPGTPPRPWPAGSPRPAADRARRTAATGRQEFAGRGGSARARRTGSARWRRSPA